MDNKSETNRPIIKKKKKGRKPKEINEVFYLNNNQNIKTKQT